jgi:hypothetical protein
MEYKTKQQKKSAAPPKFVIPEPQTPELERFEVNDPKGYVYLEENGYAVFKNVANEAERETGINLAWDFFGKFGSWD